MKINNKNSYFELILASVLRNELRDTAKYIELDTFQKIVIDNLDYMSKKMKMIFIRDIKERNASPLYGPLDNEEKWLTFANKIEKALQQSFEDKQFDGVIDINITNNELELLMLEAIKYGLGRKTYITGVILSFIIANVEVITNEVKEKMIFELENVEDYGFECDKRSWMELLDCLKSS